MIQLRYLLQFSLMGTPLFINVTEANHKPSVSSTKLDSITVFCLYHDDSHVRNVKFQALKVHTKDLVYI